MIDTHCHLNDKRFTNPGKEIDEAKKEGVNKIICCGWDIESSVKAVELARTFENVYACVGIHPHDANQGKRKENIEKLKELTKNKKVVGIGEIGLDFYRNFSPSPSQFHTFKLQVNLAKELNLPMSIHIRNAFKETFEILDEIKYYNGVLHCFSGTTEEAAWAVEKGMYVSFSGNITYKSKKLHDALLSLPDELVVIETDSPYLIPAPLKGKTEFNKPAYLKFIRDKITKIKNWSIEETDFITEKNAEALFNL